MARMGGGRAFAFGGARDRRGGRHGRAEAWRVKRVPVAACAAGAYVYALSSGAHAAVRAAVGRGGAEGAALRGDDCAFGERAGGFTRDGRASVCRGRRERHRGDAAFDVRGGGAAARRARGGASERGRRSGRGGGAGARAAVSGAGAGGVSDRRGAQADRAGGVEARGGCAPEPFGRIAFTGGGGARGRRAERLGDSGDGPSGL